MKISILLLMVVAVQLAVCRQAGSADKQMDTTDVPTPPAGFETAVFAGGCFWCTESDFEKVDGVVQAIAGYTGGHEANPSYEQVSGGGTGYVESVKVIYDPRKISYQGLLDVFWRKIDPTDAGGQFVDRGRQYRSVIFYADENQRQLAENSSRALAASGIFANPIVTEILPLGTFYPAEEDHQRYSQKNPLRYNWYRSGSGRDAFLEKIWAGLPLEQRERGPLKERAEAASVKTGQSSAPDASAEPVRPLPDEETLRRQLTPMQYQVTQEGATEPAFDNAYWDNHEEGIYVDIVSGEPLFSSADKYDSGTGWPSFTKPMEPDALVEASDRTFFEARTEVRSRLADSHLGHVFKDGPPPTGLRYSINSDALRFIPRNELANQGYGKYLPLFGQGR